ncbi:hypothetical protein DESUT3_34100 [Desulfuromonas versatilis]|uniref:ResB-like domain-containing protein n=1 Tax=Desulfuromonas versatilis TaxID=2802975 RepID=A0ABN6E5Z2_9BACT|nr:cytochrome c biogenesis protein ResB [Desulfuromonas versatilis]BCR06341.1 hypothetical protein DESUT3_34100 [Desulfuromonas versatilis]
MFIRFFSSLRLTLGLLLGLALVSVAGTLRPVADNRYEVFYQTPWFRLLLGLLALNLVVCTLKTIRRNLGDRRRQLETLGSEQMFALPLRSSLPSDTVFAALVSELRGMGYRTEQQGEQVLAVRGRAGRWGSTLVHLSCLAIMAGALAGEFGFVGTLNIHVGKKSGVILDWDRGGDRELGFEFRLDAFEPRYYPLELQFQVSSAQGDVLEEITTREGEVVPLPKPGFSAGVKQFEIAKRQLTLEILRSGVPWGVYRATPEGQSFDGPPGFDLVVVPTAFRDPVLRQTHSEVSILEGGQVVRQGVIEVNRPLVHRGVAIYQTAFDQDQFGFWYAGFQFSKDPGEPLVWCASILLMLGLALSFLLPYRVVGIRRVDDDLQLVGLGGFRGPSGSRMFARLEGRLRER